MIDLSKASGFAKQNPAIVGSVLKVLVGAVEQNPAIIPDAITAIEHKAPGEFLKAHKDLLAPLLQALAGEVFRDPSVISALLELAG